MENKEVANSDISSNEFLNEIHKINDITQKAFKSLIKMPYWEGSEFCHYTNLGGLIGILENTELWLSDHRFVNDPQEFIFGKRMAFELLSLRIENEIDSKYKELLQSVVKEINGLEKDVFYIACFSKVFDTLDQWKAYGSSNDSVCILFVNDIMEAREANLTFGPGIVPVEIYYDLDVQKNAFNHTLDVFRNDYQFSNIESKPFAHWVEREWVQSLSWVIARHFICFKDEAYKSEQEIRLILSNRLVKNTASIRHRSINSRIVPYLTTNYLRDKKADYLPIKQVIVGPRCNDDSLIMGIKTLLQNKGYKDVPVIKSKVQFR
jgi:hypothetical protein